MHKHVQISFNYWNVLQIQVYLQAKLAFKSSLAASQLALWVQNKAAPHDIYSEIMQAKLAFILNMQQYAA